MDGIHDLGGMEGFGPVPVKSGDAPFTGLMPWEQRMWGLSRLRDLLAPGITIDWFRHGIERMVPQDYLAFSYLEKWCANYYMLMIDTGTISLGEVKRGHADHAAPPAAALTLQDVLRINQAAAVRFDTPAATDPAFAPNQRVRTLRLPEAGHTRLPRYARDREGEILAHRGHHLQPEEGARGRHVGGHLYTVSFAASELWGPEADPRDSVTLDLWESYLVPA